MIPKEKAEKLYKNMKEDLKYYEQNAEEDYLNTPISVLRYISELEKVTKKL